MHIIMDYLILIVVLLERLCWNFVDHIIGKLFKTHFPKNYLIIPVISHTLIIIYINCPICPNHLIIVTSMQSEINVIQQHIN